MMQEQNEGKRSDEPAQKRSRMIEGRCQYYLEKKRRYCRSIVTSLKYCVEHSHLLQEGSTRKRITCPLDPKHSCYENQLNSHLKKCNARESIQPEYYCKNINLEECKYANQDKITLSTQNKERIDKLIDAVCEIYQKQVETPREEILSHEVLSDALNDPINGKAAQKDLQQIASLVKHMEQQQLLNNATCYIEFGAGKGGLSHWVQKATVGQNNSKYLLVEKGSCRYKMDAHHKNDGVGFERLKIDIQHLCLDKVKTLNEHARLPIVGIGKHLCGGGTDLMLRCLMQQVVGQSQSVKTKIGELSGIILALCCHHRSDWQTYVGKKFFEDNGFTADDFQIIVNMTSWATCGTRKSIKNVHKGSKSEITNEGDRHEMSQYNNCDMNETRVITSSSENLGENKNIPVEIYESVTKYTNKNETQSSENNGSPEIQTENLNLKYGDLSQLEKEEIGRKCKLLIDAGRVSYVKSFGYNCELVKYISKEITLEYVMLTAKKPF